ncbi:3-deoxy-manno-octulosonate cytidylyltransferase [Consotaella aegiceratis]|uniref:3-deoxy-manno-octulosonate cytidylyltransferase n=1 Tax=Consotaella aegiceratis TaxID=3097961 RepID=UPI002F420D77
MNSGQGLLHDTLASYSAIVVVANSEAAELTELRRALPQNTLFIFFNEASRVLAEPFDGSAVLVARSGVRGPAVVRKGKMDKILARFAPGALDRVVDLRVAEIETFVPAEGFKFPAVEFLDLVAHFSALYPGGKTPSSGYAMAAWIASLGLDCDLVLCGFTARRSDKWKVFDVHDWAFEQVALRLFERKGLARFHPPAQLRPTPVEALERQFPDLQRRDILSLGYEVLSQRIEHTNLFIDRLWSLTRFSRLVRRGLQIFRR